MRVRHVEGEYRVVLSAEAMEALHLSDGAEVEITPVAAAVAAPAEHRYATDEEVLKIFWDTLPQHENAYRELAK